jgi:hypothetical protein
MVDDILASRLDRTFDLVFDRGCFHVIPVERRTEYVRALARLAAPRGTVIIHPAPHALFCVMRAKAD